MELRRVSARECRFHPRKRFIVSKEVAADVQIQMIRHPTAFPVRLREVIRAEAGSDPRRFYWKVYHALKNLLFWGVGKHEIKDQERWEGLDDSVDTEEEVEAAVRMFPRVMKGQFPHPSRPNGSRFYPIHALTTSLKTVPFVPILAALGAELGCFEPYQQGGLNVTPKIYCTKPESPIFNYRVRATTALTSLVTNQFSTSGGDHNNQDFLTRLDEVPFATLVRLSQRGFITKEATRNTVAYSIPHATSPWMLKRIRFLLDSHPSLLSCRGRLLPLPVCYTTTFFIYTSSLSCSLNLLQTLFDLGMKYYPNEMGSFFFNESLRENDWYQQVWYHEFSTPSRKPLRFIDEVCLFFGREEVMEMINNVISKRVVRKPDAFQTSLFGAATNKDIGLDAVFLLCLQDPYAVCSLFMNNPRNGSPE